MAWTLRDWISQVQWCQRPSGGCPRGHIASFHASILQFIHHTSIHLWLPNSIRPLHTIRLPEQRSQYLYMNLTSPPTVLAFKARSSHANWTSPLCSKWLWTSTEGGTSSASYWLELAHSQLLLVNGCLNGKKQKWLVWVKASVMKWGFLKLVLLSSWPAWLDHQ